MRLLSSLALAAVAAAFAPVAGPHEAAAQNTSFLLINGTAYPISTLEVSESLLNMWTKNELGAPPIKAGERRQVRFNAPPTFCQADLKVGFADGGAPALWQNINLCTLTRIKLQYDRGTGLTTASYDD
ncbi:MAG: hypothetical protein LCH95_23220 [Proteobacteria bacterium]|nr:hypothetical protein [Pseudomonadota bacterium]